MATSTIVLLVSLLPDAVGVKLKSSLVMSVEAVESRRRMAMEEEMLAPTVLLLLPVAYTLLVPIQKQEKSNKDKTEQIRREKEREEEEEERREEEEERREENRLAIPATPKEAMPQKDKRNFAIYVLKREYSLLVLDIVPPLVWLLWTHLDTFCSYL